jgi:hypothetical protein
MPRHIKPTASLQAIFEEIIYTRAQLRAYPVTASLVEAFSDMRTRWFEVQAEELGLVEGEVTADAHAVRVDEDIDPLVDELSRTVLNEVKGDRAAPLYRRFFGRQRPSSVKRPVLGPELKTVRDWLPALAEATQELLRGVGVRLGVLVAEADAAVSEQIETDRQWDDFVTLGNRRKLVDELNTLRENTHAALVTLKNSPEGKDLAGDFADRFFRVGKRSAAEPPPSVAGLRAETAALEKELEQLRVELARLEAEEQARQEAEAKRLADEAELSEYERKAAELRARLSK